MFADSIAWISSWPFFSSLAFGIIALTITGSSWSLLGLIMGDAPKRGIDPALVILMGAVTSIAAGLAIGSLTGAFTADCSRKVFWLTCAAYAYCGVSNFFNLVFMSRAMQTGPNGIIWSIIQSAMVFPFICGMLFLGVEATALRITGIILLLVSLVFFSFGRDNSNRSGGEWKILAFVCLALCAVQQNVNTLPSYFESSRAVSSIVRTVATSCGQLVAASVWLLWGLNREKLKTIGRVLCGGRLWMYILGSSGFSLVFAYTLFYPGMDVMGAHGMGGMAFPMMVGSCIVSFTLASILILKEKMRLSQFCGLVLCVAGLILICTRA